MTVKPAIIAAVYQRLPLAAGGGEATGGLDAGQIERWVNLGNAFGQLAKQKD